MERCGHQPEWNASMATITFQGRIKIATIAIIAIFLVFAIAIIKQKLPEFNYQGMGLLSFVQKIVEYLKVRMMLDRSTHTQGNSQRKTKVFVFFNRSLSLFDSAGMSGVIGYFPGRYHYALAATVSLVCSAVHQDKLMNLIEKVPNQSKRHTCVNVQC